MKIVEHTYKTTGNLSNRKKTTEIILHCSATEEGKDYTVDTIDKWHKDRKFSCIGYHYVIYRDGTIHRGRPKKTVGAHCTNHNSISLGICYIGGLRNGKAADTRTEEQKEALFGLVKELMDIYNITLDNVHCHNEYANKSCPCFKINKFREEYLNWVEK